MLMTILDEKEIIKNWCGSTSEPLLTIICITYNHAEFIDQALNGFLTQKTNFPFELIVHDDASTDKTAEIIKKYADLYPLIIKPIFQSKNQYSQGVKISEILLDNCRGKYIAICEGDDFWTDPKKLQIQVDFLEENPEYVISGHDAFEVDFSGQCLKNSRLLEKQKRDFSKEDLILGKAGILTMSRVYRRVITEYPPEFRMVKNGDLFFASLIGHFGKSKYHHNIKPAGYRKHSGGIWSMVSAFERLESQINTHFWIYRYYSRIGKTYYAEHYWRKYLGYVFRRATSVDLIIAMLKRWIRWGWR